MSKKLEIGKTKIVIYPRAGNNYVLPKEISGICKNQQFSSSNLPKELTAVYIGKETVKGVLCDKYILKEIPEELKKLCLGGESGFKNQSQILDAVAGILKGNAKDGRKIRNARSVTAEDINKIFNIVVDFEGKKVYQNGIGKNINERKSFGNSLEINSSFSEKEIKIIRRQIKGDFIYFTSYYYSKKDLQAEEFLKELVFLKERYYLNSPGVFDYSGGVSFASGAVSNGCVYRGYGYLVVSHTIWFADELAVRPIFYLESEKKDR